MIEEIFAEICENPSPGFRIGSDPRRVENLRGEIATEEAPGRAVGGGADVAVVAIEEPSHRRRDRAVGEDGAVLDESLVRERVAGDEYGRDGADSESEDWAVLGSEVPENEFEPDGSSPPWDVSD